MKVLLGCLMFLGSIALSVIVAKEPTNWSSPNLQLQAYVTIRNEPARPDREDLIWDVVYIKNVHGQLLASLSLEKGSGIMRAAVSEAVWSQDSRFFVFATESTGGHSSWHVPTYVYDAETSNIYSIDDTLGPVTGDNDPLSISRNDILKIRFWDGSHEDMEPHRRSIDLRDFIKNEPKLALNFHHISHASDNR